MIKSRAAVAFEAKKPLEIVEVDVAMPKAGEVLLRVVASGVCHTDAYTLSGADPEGIFPRSWATRAVRSPKPWARVSPRSLSATT